jgi:hypothetical protein
VGVFHALVEAASASYVRLKGKQIDVWVLALEHLPSAVRRGVVDHHDAVGPTPLLRERREALPELVPAVTGDDDRPD